MGRPTRRRLAGTFAILSLAGCAAAFLAGVLNCSVITDFEKPLVLPEDTFCLEDDDCWDDEHPERDCHVCNTDEHRCFPQGANVDEDPFWVCERSVERGTEDCDDSERTVYPGAQELADLLDNDCDGIIDEGVLQADPVAPEAVEKPSGCEPPCLWSSPRIIWGNPYVYAVWESDEGDNQDRVRVAELTLGGASTLSEQLVVLKPLAGDPPERPDHNMTETGIARLPGSGLATPFGAVWIDLLGGRTVDFLGFDIAVDPTNGIPREAQEWPVDQNAFRDVHRDAESPVLVSHGTQNNFFLAWSGRDATLTASDIFVGRIIDVGVATDPEWTLDATFGTDGFLNVTGGSSESETGRPGFVLAGSGMVVAWTSEAKDEIRVAYMAGTSPAPPDPDDIRTIPLPGVWGDTDHALRDLVLVRAATDPTSDLVYLVFAGNPDGQNMHEIWAVSIDLGRFSSGTDGEVFGTPLRLSDSLAAPSIDVAASWHTDAIGVAWSERRGGHNHVYFRRIADLEAHRETSGVLASDEINMSLDGTDTGIYGQGPSIVATDVSAGDQDFVFAVMWWQRRPAGSTDDSGDLFMRLVEPVD